MYLDGLFMDFRDKIWSEQFLIEYFGIDLHFLNGKSDKFKNSSMRGSKVSLDLENVLE